MLMSYDRWDAEKDREQWPGGEDACTKNKPMLILASPNGTKIDCPIHGYHIIFGQKLWM